MMASALRMARSSSATRFRKPSSSAVTIEDGIDRRRISVLRGRPPSLAGGIGAREWPIFGRSSRWGMVLDSYLFYVQSTLLGTGAIAPVPKILRDFWPFLESVATLPSSSGSPPRGNARK